MIGSEVGRMQQMKKLVDYIIFYSYTYCIVILADTVQRYRRRDARPLMFWSCGIKCIRRK